MFAQNHSQGQNRAGPNPFALKRKAEKMLKSNPKKAYELICQAARQAPRSKAIKAVKLKCLIQLKRLDRALRLADQMIEISGRAIDYRNLAEVFYMRGEIQLAENAAKQSLMLRKTPGICALLAKIFYSKGWYDTAEMYIKHAMELENEQRLIESNLFMLAQIMRKKREYAKALQILDQLSDQAEQWINVKLCKAFCYFEMRKYNTALALFLELERSFDQNQQSTMFDYRVRVYTGLIFVYERIYESGRVIQPYIKGIARRAAEWLSAQAISTLGRYQRTDFQNALKIIQKLQIK